jgi:hypothetical protein
MHLAYCVLTVLLMFGLGLPGAAVNLSAAVPTPVHDADGAEREESSENEAAAREARRAARTRHVIGARSQSWPRNHASSFRGLTLAPYRQSQHLQTVLRI